LADFVWSELFEMTLIGIDQGPVGSIALVSMSYQAFSVFRDIQSTSPARSSTFSIFDSESHVAD
jgi:hypothetical protein